MKTGKYCYLVSHQILQTSQNLTMLLDCFTAMHKWQHNYEQFIKSEQPIAQINACHSSLEAKKMPCDEMSGLHPTIYLAKGAKVMLTMNLWANVGLCNGATGSVIDIICENGHNPPDLPIAVVV